MARKFSKLKVSGRLLKKKSRRSPFPSKKQCRFCGTKDAESMIDYKNASL